MASKKWALFTCILLLMMPLIAAQVPTTTYTDGEINEYNPFSAFFKNTQEFVRFPADLRPGQEFLFCTDFLVTWEEAKDIQLMYEFYQNGQFVDFKTLDFAFSRDNLVPEGERLEGCMRISFGLDKFRPGEVFVKGFLYGTKVKWFSEERGIISQIDERTFTLLDEIDCSGFENRCSKQGSNGIVLDSSPNADNSACVDRQIDFCASDEICSVDQCVSTCEPERDASGARILTQVGGACSSTFVDSCGDELIQPQDGQSCSTQGECQNGQCVNTCDSTEIGKIEPCITRNECGDILRTKPDGVACEPDPQNPVGGGYECSYGDCIKVTPPEPVVIECEQGFTLSGSECVPIKICDAGACDPPVPPEECLKDGSPKAEDKFCCSNKQYFIGSKLHCGAPPKGHCTSDASCAPGQECVDNFCQSEPVPPGETCTEDLRTECSDGSTIITAFCSPESPAADEQGLLMTGETCPVPEEKSNTDKGSPYGERDDGIDQEEGSGIFGIVLGATFVVLLVGFVILLLFRNGGNQRGGRNGR